MNILVKLPSYSLWVLIRTYQLFVSPLLAGNCRYHPTCSQFALEAVERHGPIKGTWLGIKRIVRCHPWGSSGFDPVPPQQDAYEENKSGKCIAPKHARGYIRASNSTADPEL